MSYNYCKDHRTGFTYVYEMTKQVDENGKKTTKRKLIGRLDDDGNIVPTSGRRGRLPKNTETTTAPATSDQYLEIIKEKDQQILELKSTIIKITQEKELLVQGLRNLLEQV